MDGYATHIEALINAALEAKTDILELGCGDYSTPILSAICKYRNKRFVINSSDIVWASKFKEYAEVEIVDWSAWRPTGQWGMIFLDNEEHQPARLLRVPELLKHTNIVVMHDADQAAMYPEFSQLTLGLKIETYSKFYPWTMVFRG